ncbi:hypothetical protein [Ideonella sp. A 288]|nr:hypothetical protein [Ideonella sp. A 288]
MKTTEVNTPPVNAVPLESKSEAAGSERGQQLVPALVGMFFLFSL